MSCIRSLSLSGLSNVLVVKLHDANATKIDKRKILICFIDLSKCLSKFDSKITENCKNKCAILHNFLLNHTKTSNPQQNTYFCIRKQRKNAKKTTYSCYQ